VLGKSRHLVLGSMQLGRRIVYGTILVDGMQKSARRRGAIV